MKILVISSNYPSLTQPNFGAFVYNTMQELAKQHQITIISPNKVHLLFKTKCVTYGEEKCRVHRPVYLSLSAKKMLGINTGIISDYCYERAVRKGLKKITEKPDVIYCHFLHNAIPVLDYAVNNNIPVIVASGESTYNSLEKKSENTIEAIKKQVNHIICVSEKNREQLISLGFDSEKMSVIPNAVNFDVFKPLDKADCKRKLGLSINKFIVGFTGHFIHRKGPNRIIEAIKQLEDENIQLVCVGGTKEQLIDNNFTKVIEAVPNYQLPEIFNAFDIFVLPTLNEGHCNVIEEAKACGIPIVSSKGTSVEEQIDESIGILVNPLDINEIASAILKLKQEKILYESMKKKLLERRGKNSLEERANRISNIFNLVTKNNM